MATIKPFKAYRPAPELAEKVAALPYDVMNSEEAREMVKGNPYSFLHVDKAEIDLPEDVDHYSDEVYNKAAENIRKMIAEGTYIHDETACMYLYKLVMDGRSQVGIVASSTVDDYVNDVIKKHELTRAAKEEDRIRHVDTTDFHTGPIYLTYPDVPKVNEIVDAWMQKAPVYDFTADDGIQHVVWVIDDAATIETLVAEFAKLPATYIADGHHRSASAAKVGLRRRERAGVTADDGEEYNQFLSVLFPASQLKIFDYNRVVKDLNGLSTEEFMAKIEAAGFKVEKFDGAGQYRPEGRHLFGMFLDDQWYKLTFDAAKVDEQDPIARLDVDLLQKNLLSPILGIGDPRTDERIDFVGGIRGLAELERRCHTDMKVAFAMNPTSMQDLFDIADSGNIMPPKSTWFEPKMRSGIFLDRKSVV